MSPSIGAEDNLKETKADVTLNRLRGIAIEPSSSQKQRSPSNLLQSPFKKKNGLPNPHAAGLSLRKRNMIKGRASPKFKEAKDGLDTCPLLTEEQRDHHRLTKENNRDEGQQSRIDSNRKGDLSKRFNVAGQKPPSYLEIRSGEGTQRDNRDSVWKSIDSRYAPRDDHRTARPRPCILPPSKETYNKRRYDDSFAASKHREETRRAERKHVPTCLSSKGERALEGPHSSLLIRLIDPHPDPNLACYLFPARKKKSWYEMTMEEEEEEEVIKPSTEADFNTHLGETDLNEINNPNEDKILEEDDWIIDGETFDVEDDDLMDEDELMYDENHKEEEIEQPMVSKPMSQSGERSIGAKDNLKETKADETLNRLRGIVIGPSSSQEQQSPSHPLQSPFKKKKGSPNPHAAELSLRKRNMIKGRASPKFKETKDGPSMGSKSSMGWIKCMMVVKTKHLR
ncbi:LOW QUALITY PROTEIN: hypothetical protein HID58_048137 [Brassica napus]|uniref:Uncharacterized protein n=1 Tax=Brassica napus TaxID=3708 RepID=A0ABQ8B190_BRANA|nr:LOW QUALITY PROTEIN: hypothetical protein HID58_048137 [Brassica napus]